MSAFFPIPAVAAVLCLGLSALFPTVAQADQITVFAAASTKTALDEISTGFSAETGHQVALSLAGSSALARQIEQGAPADLFISANTDWMDHLEGAGLIAPETRFDLLGNTIVLIAHGPADPVTLSGEVDLAGMLGEGKLAMALVDAVPAGIYGKAALQSLGLWDSVAANVAQADNVRGALALVAAGEAPYGIVYATDAAAAPDVSVIATFPADSHAPIVYPVAAIAGRANPAALLLLDYLRGDVARAAFTRQGFAVLAE